MDFPTPLQGLYSDLLGCLGGLQEETDPKPMSGFSKILNMITEVVNERQNTATTGDVDVTASNSETEEPGIRQLAQQSSTYSIDSYACQSCPSESCSIPLLDGQVENPIITSQSMSSIPPQSSQRTSEVDSESMSESDIENNNKIEDILDNQQQGSDHMHNFPIEISDEVAKVLKQFGLEGLIPPPDKNISRNGSCVTVPSETAHLDQSSICSVECAESAEITVLVGQDVSGDNNPDFWSDKSPLSIGGSMLTNLLNDFTKFRNPGTKFSTTQEPGGMSDAESCHGATNSEEE